MTNPNPFRSPTSCSLEEAKATATVLHNAKRLLVILCVLPLLDYLFVWGFWFTAGMMRSRWVIPGLDDPKSFLFGIPDMLHIMLMLASFSVAPAVFGLGIRCRALGVSIAGYVACLVTSIFLFRLDIWQTTTWIAD